MLCSELEELLKNMKRSKVIDDRVKARNFIKNIDSFKNDLSSKIALFTQYKDSVDYDSIKLIMENQDIFDKIEELNEIIISKKTSNNLEKQTHEYFGCKEEYSIEQEDILEELDKSSFLDFSFDI